MRSGTIRAGSALLLGLMLTAVAQAAAAVNPCEAVLDYSDDLRVSDTIIESIDFVGDGQVEVSVSVTLQNETSAVFDSATLEPAAGNVEITLLEPATFGAILPSAPAFSDASLRIVLAESDLPAVESSWQDGTFAWTVRADEVPQYAPGVRIGVWSAIDEATWSGAGLSWVGSPSTPPPILTAFEGAERFFIVENPDEWALGSVPYEFRNMEITNVTPPPDDVEIGLWVASGVPVSGQSLAELVDSGSFCTTASHAIDDPIQMSRAGAPESARLAGHAQPVRLNEYDPNGEGVTLSGQVSGQKIIPSVGIKFRDGKLKLASVMNTDVSFALGISARYHVAESKQEELWSLCFPLPDLWAGPISIPLNLELHHFVGIEAELDAGVTFGIGRHLSGSASTDHDESAAEGSRNTAHSSLAAKSSSYTPAAMTYANAFARVWTDFQVTLRVGSRYPICETGTGITSNTQVYGQLSFDSEETPMWDARLGVAQSIALDVDIFGIDIAHWEKEFEPLEIQADFAPPDTTETEMLGHDQRWAMAIRSVQTNPFALSKTVIAPNGDSLVITRGPLTHRNRFMRADPNGLLLQQWDYKLNRVPHGVAVSDDGSFVVAGRVTNSGNPWVVGHDSSGAVEFAHEYDLFDPEPDTDNDRCVIDQVVGQVFGGAQRYLLLGKFSRSSVFQYDGCGVLIDTAGDVVWAKIFDEASYGLIFRDAADAGDGGFVLAGNSRFRATTGVDPLVARIDAAGEIVWAKIMPTLQGREFTFNGVTVGSDGRYYLAGGGTGRLGTGSFTVARIDADGADPHHVSIFQDEAWEDALDFESWTDTHGGMTPWDEAADIIAVGDALVAVGKTGLGDESAAWAVALNQRLGVLWFTTVDGDLDDRFQSVADAGDGLVVTGITGSQLGTALPEATTALMLLKLPYTGLVDFSEHIQLSSRYVEPGTVHTSADSDVTGPEVTMDVPIVARPAGITAVRDVVGMVIAPAQRCVSALTRFGHIDPFDCDNDSDLDGILDRAEDLDGDHLVGPGETDARQADTDRDGTDDGADECPLDPDRTVPGDCGCGVVCGAERGFVVDLVRALSEALASLDPTLVEAPTPQASGSRLASLATRVGNAADALELEDDTRALDLLTGVSSRMDGISVPGDWLIASPETEALSGELLFAIELVLLL